MLISAMDHVVVPVSSLAEASSPYERLGLNLSAPLQHQGIGTENRVFMVGSTEHFYVELLGIRDRDEAERAGRHLYLEHVGRGIARLMLEVDDIAAAVAALAAAGIVTEIEQITADDGRKLCEVAPLEGGEQPGFALGLIEYPEPRVERFDRRRKAGRFEHEFPLKRLDHLAAIAPDLEAATRFFGDVLQVPVWGEVRGRGMIIRQLKMGDAIMELLGPDGADSPLNSRPAGLASMCAWEVESLDDAVRMARERGFSPSEPGQGALPGTRVATIPATELSGVSMQLLEYV